MPKSSKPWTSRSEIKLRGVPKKDRVLDVIDVAWGAAALAIRGAASVTMPFEGVACNSHAHESWAPMGPSLAER